MSRWNPIPVADRLNAKLDKSGGPDACWPFMGARANGYGRIGDIVGGKPKGWIASRLAYILEYGDIPEGLNVCHRCDNAACCNPKHLYAGTQLQNIHDAMTRGRHSKPPHGAGGKNNAAILTDSEALNLKIDRKAGYTRKQLMDKYKVGLHTVKGIISGRHYKCLP